MGGWWKAVGRYPATWVAIGLVLVAEWAFFVLFRPPPVLAGILIAIGVLAVVVWPLMLSATGTLNRLLFIPTVAEIEPDDLAELEGDLAGLPDAAPAEQLRGLRDKRENLKEVLDDRLHPGELTYARYLSTAQRVYVAAIGNLREIAIASRNIGAFDGAYIDRRLAELKDATGIVAEAERLSLKDRLALRDAQREEVARRMAQNESAMTLLDRTAAALAAAPTGRLPEDAEATLEALKELAERADRYSAQSMQGRSAP